jgi:hypothetical protein
LGIKNLENEVVNQWITDLMVRLNEPPGKASTTTRIRMMALGTNSRLRNTQPLETPHIWPPKLQKINLVARIGSEMALRGMSIVDKNSPPSPQALFHDTTLGETLPAHIHHKLARFLNHTGISRTDETVQPRTGLFIQEYKPKRGPWQPLPHGAVQAFSLLGDPNTGRSTIHPMLKVQEEEQATRPGTLGNLFFPTVVPQAFYLQILDPRHQIFEVGQVLETIKHGETVETRLAHWVPPEQVEGMKTQRKYKPLTSGETLWSDGMYIQCPGNCDETSEVMLGQCTWRDHPDSSGRQRS